MKILMGVALMAMLALAAGIVTYRLYKKELKSKDWFQAVYYEFLPVECPHLVRIKLVDTGWRFLFKMRKEQSVTIQAGPAAGTVTKEQFRLDCPECGKKRWFVLNNKNEVTKKLFTLRIKYMVIGLAGIVILLGITGNLLNWLLGF